eukprot:SAG22_NODE_129_length_18679_cov_40.656028_13_plen_97_part_00
MVLGVRAVGPQPESPGGEATKGQKTKQKTKAESAEAASAARRTPAVPANMISDRQSEKVEAVRARSETIRWSGSESLSPPGAVFPRLGQLPSRDTS